MKIEDEKDLEWLLGFLNKIEFLLNQSNHSLYQARNELEIVTEALKEWRPKS